VTGQKESGSREITQHKDKKVIRRLKRGDYTSGVPRKACKDLAFLKCAEEDPKSSIRNSVDEAAQAATKVKLEDAQPPARIWSSPTDIVGCLTEEVFKGGGVGEGENAGLVGGVSCHGVK